MTREERQEQKDAAYKAMHNVCGSIDLARSQTCNAVIAVVEFHNPVGVIEQAINNLRVALSELEAWKKSL